MDKVKAKIETIPGVRGDFLKKKFKIMLTRNLDVKLLQSVSEVLSGKATNLPERFSIYYISTLMFCPTTGVDVARTLILHLQLGFE